MNNLPEIGSVVTFGKRRGHIMGYSVASRHGYKERMQVFALVDLSPESQGWLELDDQHSQDTFISAMILNIGNIDTVDGVMVEKPE